MLVIHENRGLTDHIRSVADRLAGAGSTALAIDLLSEEGGTDAIADEGDIGGVLGAGSPERLVDDMRTGLDELERRLPGTALGIIGFCFGGGMVWALLDAGDPRLAAAIPFYGPAPEAPDFTDVERGAGVSAEQDDRVNPSQERVRLALEAAGLTHRINVLPWPRSRVLQRHGWPLRPDAGRGRPGRMRSTGSESTWRPAERPHRPPPPPDARTGAVLEAPANWARPAMTSDLSSAMDEAHSTRSAHRVGPLAFGVMWVSSRLRALHHGATGVTDGRMPAPTTTKGGTP